MDEIEVEVVDTELGEGVIKSTFDILGGMEVVRELRQAGTISEMWSNTGRIGAPWT